MPLQCPTVLSIDVQSLRIKRFGSFHEWEIVRRTRPAAKVFFVPTMGALHDGHAALVRTARNRADTGVDGDVEVVVSIFINPTQFNEPSDFEQYPSTPEDDVALLANSGADSVVFPTVDEMYPSGIPEAPCTVDFGALTSQLEGARRPGHFDGVVSIVRDLFLKVKPTVVFFGEKDWQQLAVIQHLVRREFNGLEVVPVPTVRESDGLAMSSRNLRLSVADRAMAPVLYAELDKVAGHGSPREACAEAIKRLEQQGFDVEYLEVRHGLTLEKGPWDPGAMRVFVAAWLGGVRLIDNVVCVK